MIERIIEYSVRNRIIVIILALVVAGVGVHAVINTPVDAIPDLSENQVIVFADWPGRSPREVEDQVTYPLSVNLQGLAGIKAIRSTSEFGFSMINLIFDDGVEFYFARERVLERLSIASTFLPEGVSAYLAPDATALGQIFWYTVEGEGYDLGRLRAIQDWFVRYQLYSVPGVAEVASVGGFPIEYQVDVDPNKLRAYGVTLGELYSAVSRANSAVGGRVIQKANAEYLVRSVGWIESLEDVENIVVKSVAGTPVYVSNVAAVQFGSAPRRAVLEKNGNEAVGGVVLMRYGENPLEVTQRIKEKIQQLQTGLPAGVHIVPFYERTRLIEDAIGTVTGTLAEEMIVASLAIVLILWHLRSALIVCITLPMAVLVSFILMRYFGVPSNIMSLSGIAISIGVLVDSSIVMVENATHHLHDHFGSGKVRGDTRDLVLPALRTVGRPIFFSVVIMVISFIPVFALGGMEGRMFHPLAFTKTFAMVGVAILAITLVPALVPLLVRGRLRSEEESWIVRSFIEIYRPVLSYLLEHPWPIFWLTGVIFIVGLTPIGVRTVFHFTLFVALAGTWLAARQSLKLPWRIGVVASLVLVALVADQKMGRLGREFMPPLDEGSILDMPLTVPRASITQAADDLKARDRLLRMFPEVELVVGKAGRAETPTDPAPPDMIETVVNLRPKGLWPKRKLRFDDASKQSTVILSALEAHDWITPPPNAQDRADFVNQATMDALVRFDETMRGFALERYAEFEHRSAPELTRFAVDETIRLLGKGRKLGRAVAAETRLQIAEELAPRYGSSLAENPDLVTVTQMAGEAVDRLVRSSAVRPQSDPWGMEAGTLEQMVRSVAEVIGAERQTFFTRLLTAIEDKRAEGLRKYAETLNWEVFDRGTGAYCWLALEALIDHAREAGYLEKEPNPEDLQALRGDLEGRFARWVFLWQKTKDDLLKEMDTAIQMPGWGNIWTQPIINRVDMLATGVRTMIGVKVYGNDLEQIQRVSEEVAGVLKQVPGAVDVFPDQIVGEGYLQIDIDRERAARYGVSVGDIQDVIETALGGKVITMTVEGRERFPVRIRYARAFREDEEQVENLLVSASGRASMGPPDPPHPRLTKGGQGVVAAGMNAAAYLGSPADRPNAQGGVTGPAQVPLSMVADVQIVEGPSMIKSENGLLRAYVQLNVRDRDIVGFVDEAQGTVAEKVKLPQGMYLEWSGQFEHQMRARKTLQVIFPVVIFVIFVILYVTYNDLADATLMMFAVPGAVAGGVLFQWLWGFNFSVAVWVGYIACFGLATETGIVMLVYLREAVEKAGGLAGISLAELRQAVIDGAVHRLRPKLLTEGTTIVGLAPMLWATGTGAEIMRPMAAPVLGGILVADEVIDILLPVLFYWVRRRRWQRLHAGAKAVAETGSGAPAERHIEGAPA